MSNRSCSTAAFVLPYGFIGSIKKITTGIWLGYDDNRETDFSSGIAASLWKTYTKGINVDYWIYFL
mgnify:CR=1 FL=1